jgi:hypothetical protein
MSSDSNLPCIKSDDNCITLIGIPDFHGRTIRKTLGEPPKISVFDLITAIVETEYPRNYFDRLKAAQTDKVTPSLFIHTYKFPGHKQKETPVVDAHGMIVIMHS